MPPDGAVVTTTVAAKAELKCREKRDVCSAHVECICRQDRAALIAPRMDQGIQEAVLAALREKIRRAKRRAILCASVVRWEAPLAEPDRDPDEGVLLRLNSGQLDKILPQSTCNTMPAKSLNGFLSLGEEKAEQDGRVHVKGTINFGLAVGDAGRFVLTNQSGVWRIAEATWGGYEGPGR
jgi:hypothetical protein